MLNDGLKKILLVDDNEAIHEDFRKVLEAKSQDKALEAAKTALFGPGPETADLNQTANFPVFQIESAYQGEEALSMVVKASSMNRPYAMAFVDIRMPPGWDGIVTIKKIWEVDPDIQIVICSAYSDYSWEEINSQLMSSDNFLILKKPFDMIEVRQLAAALTKKWELKKQVRYQIEHLETLVRQRTDDLEKSLSLTKATLEATQEGILAVGKKGRVIDYNGQFLKLWNIPEDILKEGNPAPVFQAMAMQMEDAMMFFRTVSPFNEQKKMEGIREWRLKSGEVFELYIHPQYLHHKKIGTVYSFRSITERKRLEEELLRQATHDELTGLPNRALLADRMIQVITHANRYGQYVGILMLDIDNFKQINDSLGHKAGDTLLKIVTERLVKNVRGSDTVARLSGDEFVVVMSVPPKEENLLGLVKKLTEVFLAPCSVDGHDVTITISIGVSVYPKDGTDYDTLLKNADAALYRAKNLGRNSFQFYLPEFNEYALRHMELATALSQALEREELTIYYQPLIHLDSNRAISVEALLRWTSPQLGQVPPSTFIPLAEDSGLIVPIGEWVLKHACKQLKMWHGQGFPDLCLAVNVSARQFRQKNFIDMVRNALGEANLDPKYLEVEITETLILKDIQEVRDKMLELKDMGVRLVMDDFGTGYSSLSYLKNFPFDKVKIDKSFIDNIVVNPEDSSIVEAIIQMTRSLSMEVVAEGVEKKDQVTFLKEHHGDQVQGYYFSPPLDKDGCTEALKKFST